MPGEAPGDGTSQLVEMMGHHGRQALTEQEHGIMAMRLGIGDPEDKMRTLSEVGERFGMDRDTVRSVERRAISKLRHPQWNHSDG